VPEDWTIAELRNDDNAAVELGNDDNAPVEFGNDDNALFELVGLPRDHFKLDSRNHNTHHTASIDLESEPGSVPTKPRAGPLAVH
jgi:hypothetical protein